MKMGITLQEVKGTKADFIEKREKEKAKLIDELITSIDEMIALSIDDLMKKPVMVGQASWEMAEHCDEIMARYDDFTVIINHNPNVTRSIAVKLADKDWDWYGYGVKPPLQDAEQSKPKKKRFLWWGKAKQPDRKFTVL